MPLPRALTELIRLVICHRDPERHALLYEAVWRTLHGERHLLEVATDPLVHRLERMAKAVRRDLHKMHAFVRFRRVEDGGAERFVAWFEPEHFILEAAAPFFVDRFRSLDWTILTLDRLASLGSLRALASGLQRSARTRRPRTRSKPGGAATTRAPSTRRGVNLVQTRAEMPKKYWRNLPETAAIPAMVRIGPSRVEAMISKEASHARAPQSRESRRRHGRAGARARSTSSTA